MRSRFPAFMLAVVTTTSMIPLVTRVVACDDPAKNPVPEKPTNPATVPSVGLDFSQCTYKDGKKDGEVGTLDGGELFVEVTLAGTATKKVSVNLDKGLSGNAVALALATQIGTIQNVTAINRVGGLVQIIGSADSPLQSVVVTLPGKTTRLQSNTAGGAKCITKNGFDESIVSKSDIQSRPQGCDDPMAKNSATESSKPTIEFKEKMIIGLGEGSEGKASYTVIINLRGMEQETKFKFDFYGICIAPGASALALETQLRGAVRKDQPSEWKYIANDKVIIIEGWTDPKTKKFFPAKEIKFESPDIQKKYWPTTTMPHQH